MSGPPVLLPYGRGTVPFLPPPGCQLQIVEPPLEMPTNSPEELIREALARPLDSPPIAELARGARSAAIVVTDSTRPCPDQLLLTPLLAELEMGGIPPDRITIVVAIGMHRPSSDAEKKEKLGEAICARYRVVDSAAADPVNQVDLSPPVEGIPIRIDRRVAEADLLIATGIVEPHQYAGFSGGWKTVSIGTATTETITELHGMRFLEDPGVRLGSTTGNPFLEMMRRIGERVGLRFVVNVVLDPGKRVLRAAAGHPESVHRTLVEWTRSRIAVPIDAPRPIVIGAAGHPKDSNLYQATRIPTYLGFGAGAVVAPGGVMIVPAECSEGAGEGEGERLFERMLMRDQDPAALLARVRREGYPAGGQRAVMVAWTRQRAAIAFVGTRDPELPKRLGFESFATVDEAVAWARMRTGSDRILVVPQALTTLIEVASPTPDRV